MSDMFLLYPSSKIRSLRHLYLLLNVRTFDFVNGMNSCIDIHNHLFVFVCCSNLNMLVAGKYGVPKNTLSTVVKNKDKLLDSL